MLRDLILLVLIINIGLLFFADQKTAATLLIIAVISLYLTKRSYSHIVSKELSYISGRLAQILPWLTVAFLPILVFGPVDIKKLLPFYCALILMSVPVLLHFVVGKSLARSETQLGQFRIIRIIRCTFALSVASLFIVLFGLVGFITYHLLPSLNIAQLIAAEVVMALPLMALKYDKSPHKLIKVSDKNLRSHTISKSSFTTYAGFGFLAALLSYGNYLFLFYRHGLNPTFLDPTLPLYRQAASLALVTLVVCMFLNIMFERIDKHQFFINEHTLENKSLLKAFGVSLVLLVVIVYAPLVSEVFQTASLDVVDWLSVVFAGIVYSTFRMAKRHTRKHSRRAVLRLYKQINP